MSKVILGHVLIDQDDGSVLETKKELGVDLPKLRSTRLLVQAGSGGGKTWLLRRLIEQSYGKVQQIIFDIEGDFVTLREKYDFLIVGKDRDLPADPRAAELLAHKILELQINVIFDLYEYSKKETENYAKLMIESLLNAPKKLWGGGLAVYLDELDVLAPERTEGEALSTESVAALLKRGRKRGFIPILATQRISAVNKTVISQCRNKLIGYADLDLDVKRSAAMLNFTSNEQRQELVDLDAGEFFARGPAFGTKKAIKLKIGPVETTHEESSSSRVRKTPALTGSLKKMLAKLTDLPKEAEADLRDREAMTKRIRELERELKTARPVEKFNEKIIEKIKAQAQREAKQEFQKLMSKLGQLKNRLQMRFKEIGILIDSIPDDGAPTASPVPPVHTQSRINPIRYAVAHKPAKVEIEGRTFGQCERKILGFLSMKPGEYFTKIQVGTMTGYSHGSGGFSNALSNLTQAGLIFRNGSSIALNPEADVSELVDKTPHRLEDWIQKLGQCERKIYEHLLSEPNEAFSKEQLGEMTGYSSGSGGFSNSISHLNTLGLIKRHHDGRISLNPEVAGL